MKLPFFFKFMLLLILLVLMVSNSRFIFSTKFRRYLTKYFLNFVKNFVK